MWCCQLGIELTFENVMQRTRNQILNSQLAAELKRKNDNMADFWEFLRFENVVLRTNQALLQEQMENTPKEN